MQQRFYFEYESNGNLDRTEFLTDKLYQGQQAAVEYSLKMADNTDVDNWLSTDSVFINFTRPDGKTASINMGTYDSEYGGWKKVTNGWETDVDISVSSDLTVSFSARRYSTVDATLYVNLLPSESVVLTIYPTAEYTPLNLATGELETITNELANHETRIDGLEGEMDTAQGNIVDLGNNKVDKLTATTGTQLYARVNGVDGYKNIAQEQGGIPVYGANASITIGSVPSGYSAANKLYVDNQDTATLISAESYADGVAATAESNANYYTDTKSAGYVPLTQKGAASGVCPLGADNKVASTYLPSYVDDTLEYSSFSALPTTGESGKLYVTLDTNLTYRWSGTQYTEVSKSLALGETDTTAYRGDRGKIAYDGVNTLNPIVSAHTAKLAKIDVGTISPNLDNETINGFKTAYSTTTGVPDDTLSTFTLHQNSNVNNNSAAQISIPYSTTPQAYLRLKQASEWGDYEKFILTNNESFPYETGTITDNMFTYDCRLRKNYILTNTQDVTVFLESPKNGQPYVIEMHGGYALDVNFKTTSYVDAISSGIIYLGNIDNLYVGQLIDFRTQGGALIANVDSSTILSVDTENSCITIDKLITEAGVPAGSFISVRCKTDLSFTYNTVLDNTMFYNYEGVFNGTKWKITRNVFYE